MAKHIERGLKAALFIAAILYMPYKVFEWITIETFKTQVFLAFVGSALQGVFSKGGDAASGNFGTKFANRSPIAPRGIVYGECRVGGTIVMLRTSGTDNHKLHFVIALAGHKLNSLQKVFIGANSLTTTTSGGFQVVTNSTYTNTDNDNAFTGGRLMRFRFVNGSQTTADATVRGQMPGMSTADIGKDIAYVYVECIYDSEKFGSFPNLAFRVRGKEVFDPRDSSTAYSDNPALIIRDYLTDTTYGLKAESDEINDTTNAGGFSSAANTCEQTVTVGSGTETRYTLNGFTDMGANPEDVLRMLMTSCGGKLSYVDGKFQLFVAAAQTPSLTITDDDMLSKPTFATGNSASLPNAVKSVFVDSQNRFVAGDCPIEEDSTFLSEDTPTGESSANYKRLLELQLPFTTSGTMAQRLQRIFLRESRQTTAVTLQLPIKFMRCQPGDWVYLTNSRLGFTNKTFEVQGVGMIPNESDTGVFLTCELQLREIEASVTSFTFNEYSTPATDDDPGDSDDRSISAPTSLSGAVQNITDGATQKINIVASWTNALNDAISGTEVQYKLSTDSEFSSFTVMKGVTRITIPNLSDQKTYNIKARHFTSDNIFSDFTATVNVAINLTEAPDAPTSLTATSSRKIGMIVSWTNPANTNLRAIKVYRKTNNTTPTDDTNLIRGVAGEPGKRMQVFQGYPDGLVPGTTYYFWVRAVNHLGNHSSFVGSAQATFNALGGGDVGLENLNDLDSAANTKLGGIEDNATLGAKLGVNFKDSSNNALGDEDVRNSDLDIDFTGNTTFRLKKGSTVINSQAFTKTNVGLSDLDSLEAGTGTKLSGIEAGATLGATAGTNLKDSGNNTLNDADVRNSDLVIAKNNQDIQIKKGSTLIDSISIDKSTVGLSDLNSLESGSGTKLSGIEAGATLGATAGTNLKDSGNNTLGDEDVRNSDLVITKSSQNIQIKKGTTLIDSVGIDKGTVGLSDLNSLESGTGTKLGGIEANATVGAVAGTNLKDSSNNTLADADVRNDDLVIDTSTTTFRLKKGSTVINTTTLDKGSVGLSDLNSLESGSGTKLGGIEANATVGATAGTNIKDSSNNTLQDEDIRNSDLRIAKNSQTIQIKKGATLIDDISIDKSTVGLSDLNSLESGTGTKLGGIASGATNNGSTVNSNGQITGTLAMASGGSITVNTKMTIDFANERILVQD